MICLLCKADKAAGMIHELDIGNHFICTDCDRNNQFIKKHSSYTGGKNNA